MTNLPAFVIIHYWETAINKQIASVPHIPRFSCHNGTQHYAPFFSAIENAANVLVHKHLHCQGQTFFNLKRRQVFPIGKRLKLQMFTLSLFITCFEFVFRYTRIQTSSLRSKFMFMERLFGSTYRNQHQRLRYDICSFRSRPLNFALRVRVRGNHVTSSQHALRLYLFGDKALKLLIFGKMHSNKNLLQLASPAHLHPYMRPFAIMFLITSRLA